MIYLWTAADSLSSDVDRERSGASSTTDRRPSLSATTDPHGQHLSALPTAGPACPPQTDPARSAPISTTDRRPSLSATDGPRTVSTYQHYRPPAQPVRHRRTHTVSTYRGPLDTELCKRPPPPPDTKTTVTSESSISKHETHREPK